MSSEAVLLLALFIPLASTVFIAANDTRPDWREGATLLASLLLLGTVLSLLPEVLAGGRPSVDLFELIPGLPLRLTVEPLGMMFAGVAALLWPLNSLYSIGYMRGNKEQHQTRFYVCFAVAIASAIGVAFSGNLLTLFVFYEALTLSTYPLVTHKGTPEAMRAGRLYLGILLGTSIGLLLLAIVWTWRIAGVLDFTPGGILAGHIEGPAIAVLLALFVFGIGKAALMPFHHWLPAAMVAPTPVSALLHAVAVVKAGVFAVMKVIVYVFGIDFLSATSASQWLMWVAALTILLASCVAMTQDNLKARLAYSTISQLGYVVLGAALATSLGVIGGSMQIAMHAMGKITLFFCAGAIYTATHKTEISQMDGLGRVMPFTFGAFLIGSLSIIGLPPLGGSWSKWYLLAGTADAGQWAMMAVLLVSSLLNVAYLLPIAARGFFAPLTHETGEVSVRETPLACIVPLCLTASGCVLLFFSADALYTLLAPIATR
ncbi:MAG TPA: proton-conducting transporter membrane subunit [Candidatus Competibacteraceae bacterium]|nr:proton-conducting transporter membrane subunit [Candidatus Competibacteraceae bacterium]HRZ06627.1 proton-conducting transporter membrane subunit [Candidatus Competibacteraceae bacterium]HSA48307.1 proton-conducting transporter membrane subunit [Candidatus Competibacteraceae bacterium]